MDGLKDLQVAIVMHAYTPPNGLVLELIEYLNRSGARVHLIVHPFPSARMPHHSTLQVIDHGKAIRESRTFAPRGPEFLFYILDIFFTLYLIRCTRARIDLFIGLDNLNTLAGVIARKLGLARSVVFYVIDYVPQRFGNRWLNDVYHWIDKVCCRHANVIWNVSSAMMEARRTKWGSLDGCAPSIVVPWGCRFERIERLPISQINRREVVFLGSLLPEQGINLLFEAWPAVQSCVPDARLVIVGGGVQEQGLRALAEQLGIASSIKFVGFVQEDAKIERILTRAAVGVAPYREDSASFKYYCDPSKVKSYLGAGLPVVITRVPPVAQLIHEVEAGLAIKHDAPELSEAIIRLLTQDEVYERYRANAIRLAAQFSWDKIFYAALSQTLAPAQSSRRAARGAG